MPSGSECGLCGLTDLSLNPDFAMYEWCDIVLDSLISLCLSFPIVKSGDNHMSFMEEL